MPNCWYFAVRVRCWWQNPKPKLDRADRAMLATLRAARCGGA